jgi:hypothetical protein
MTRFKGIFSSGALLFSLVGCAVAQAAVPTPWILRAQEYYQDRASRKIEELVPAGQFALQVGVEWDEGRWNREQIAQRDDVTLPLGRTRVVRNELTSDGPDDSLNQILSYVKHVRFKLSVPSKFSDEMRKVLKTSLASRFALSADEADSIEFENLPRNSGQLSHPEEEAAGGFGRWLQHPLMLVLLASVGFLLGILALSRALSQMGATLGTKLGTENGANNAADARFSRSVEPAAAATGASAWNDANPMIFWDRVSLPEAIAMLRDCMESEHFSSYPLMLLSECLPIEVSRKAQHELPESLFPERGSGQNSARASLAQVTDWFRSHFLEYSRCSASELAREVLLVPRARALELLQTLPEPEALFFLSQLTPIRRREGIERLSVQRRIELFRQSGEAIDRSEEKRQEARLRETLRSPSLVTSLNVGKARSMSYLSDAILDPQSFEEDELIHGSFQGSGGHDYVTVLKAFELFVDADWEVIGIQDFAITFFGYSDATHALLRAKFKEKRREWLDSYLNKLRSEPLAFHSDPVARARAEVLRLISLRSKVQDAQRTSTGEGAGRRAA